jgi:hypothetical protein
MPITTLFGQFIGASPDVPPAEILAASLASGKLFGTQSSPTPVSLPPKQAGE